MKNSIFSIAVILLFLVFSACNKEEPQQVSALFTTNLQSNTMTAGAGVTIYTSEATGEFLTYFIGIDSTTTFGTGFGTNIELGTDSLVLNYYDEGTYTFTLVASSYGNWGETVNQDVQSVDINVVVAE